MAAVAPAAAADRVVKLSNNVVLVIGVTLDMHPDFVLKNQRDLQNKSLKKVKNKKI
jgi:hypothetical protein